MIRTNLLCFLLAVVVMGNICNRKKGQPTKEVAKDETRQPNEILSQGKQKQVNTEAGQENELSVVLPTPPNQELVTLKEWFKNLSKTPQPGKVSKQLVLVQSDRAWLKQLGLTGNENVLVNASNESISFGGGGLNGALTNYASKVEGQKAWENLVLPDGSSVTPGKQIAAGEYALSDISFGRIFHAVGPVASATKTLQEAENKVTALYYNMLCRAHNDGVECIVLPAISTAIFAGAGPGFTKAEFIRAMYRAMKQGIDKFEKEHPGYRMSITLNNWDLRGVTTRVGL